MKIYCPKCSYEPTPDVLWTCRPGCDYAWHTFDTHGQCPNCFKWWKVTQCPECHVWSPHDEWYHDMPPVETEQAEEVVSIPA